MCFEDSLSLSGFRFLSSIHSFPQENKTKQEKCQFEGARGKKKKSSHRISFVSDRFMQAHYRARWREHQKW